METLRTFEISSGATDAASAASGVVVVDARAFGEVAEAEAEEEVEA